MKRALSFLAIVLLAAGPAAALEMPKGAVILTISGKVAHPNLDGKAVFDLDMLEALQGRTATMETPWTEGKVQFAGPLLRAVLTAAGVEGQTMTVKALNGYTAEVPVSDAYDMETILATRLAGKPMSVREKGPLMLVYPFDLDASLYNERYFSRSVWQIQSIEVAP
ncbi:molybdopterin-dependent oxidoreductase [Rhizobium sp. CG5]|uniref:molybdopterin-dependent oxidoreductase n=1 Tax=Rhizobium sp. CG5 TaxID=2726076 RepID=UPI002034428B|nr:molybdopterin-dependent oxidoreductase [Rhizobium sp. CG5]MCM2472650.1 molybdopterin-dependent oxidoreductase [Rhizobium sp. CG5]